VGISLQQQLRDALNQARKGRDKARTVLLTSTLSEIRNREIELGHEADDDAVREVLARGIKQRKESAEQMRAGKREDLASREDAEAAALAHFLPPPLSEEEVRVIVREIRAEGVTQVGPMMGKLISRIRGRFDGKEANRIVREELAG
jgi:uncharacterized protein YqeY